MRKAELKVLKDEVVAVQDLYKALWALSPAQTLAADDQTFEIALERSIKTAYDILTQDSGAALGDGTFLQRLLELIFRLLPIILEILRGGVEGRKAVT